jgi:DNA-binding NtrC family response regulator
VAVDVRVVAATNADLLRRTDDGSFRRDLYYRVAGYALHVPPLRERREDVPGLVESFVRVFVRETGRPVRGITARAMEALVSYAWPGNVRELEHEVRRLVYLCPEGEPIESAMLSPALRSTLAPAAAAEEAPADGLPLEAAIEQLERRLIREALARAGGNRSEAARRLGISRNGLALKMQRLGLGD